MRWEELTGDLFPEAVQKAEGVCLLPLSVIERHGHHMPLGTDMFIGREVCNRTAALESAIVFPDFIFTQILEARHYPGCIGIDADLTKIPAARSRVMGSRKLSLSTRMEAMTISSTISRSFSSPLHAIMLSILLNQLSVQKMKRRLSPNGIRLWMVTRAKRKPARFLSSARIWYAPRRFFLMERGCRSGGFSIYAT